MADILPSPDAESLIDFTCESLWERFALDVELVFRAWKLCGSEIPDSVPLSDTSVSTSAPLSGLESPALAACSLLLAERRSFVLQLRNDAHDTSLDAAPLQRLLGTPSCIVLLSGSGDAPVAWDMSDAASLLSALSVAASACDVTLPLIVPVGRASEFRLLGRRAGAHAARFCCDCNAFVPDALGHLAGLLALFESKRGAARRSLSPSQRSARISAKFTYTWTDFSLRVPAPLPQHRDASAAAAARRLAAVHADALADHDPVRTLRLAALWDAFPAHELQRSADRAAMRAVAADRIRLSAELSSGARAARAAAATAPLAAPPRACVRLALRGDNDGAPAAAASLVHAVQDGVRGNVDAFTVVRSLFFDDARSVLTAAALNDKSVDDEFVAGALAALFDMHGTRGLMSDVMDALGPLAAELPLLERVARLTGALAEASVSLLWQLFVDGVEIHWKLRRPLPGVAADPQGGPLLYDTLISQKLQMINCCILREQTDARLRTFCERGTAGRKVRIDNVSLVGAGVDGEVWEPHVQPSSLVTRDLVEAQHDRMVSGQNGNERSKEEMRTLTSDMSAFKAANPHAEMADFLRWFSPSDWITDDDAAAMAAVVTADGSDVPSGSSEEKRGGRLSARMRKPGNEWEMLWQAAKAVPAHEQTALFDTDMHGTDAVRDLRQMPLCAVLLQLGCLCGAGGARTLHDALAGSDLPLPLVCGQAESARAAFRAFAATTKLGYANREKMREDADMLSDAVAVLASAERAALAASSLRTKLPDVGEFRRAIDALAVGGSFELVGSSERALLVRIARLDDSDWRAALLPEHREFLLVGDDGEVIANGTAAAAAHADDRMYARLSSDEFRTAFRLCVDYGV